MDDDAGDAGDEYVVGTTCAGILCAVLLRVDTAHSLAIGANADAAGSTARRHAAAMAPFVRLLPLLVEVESDAPDAAGGTCAASITSREWPLFSMMNRCVQNIKHSSAGNKPATDIAANEGHTAVAGWDAVRGMALCY